MIDDDYGPRTKEKWCIKLIVYSKHLEKKKIENVYNVSFRMVSYL